MINILILQNARIGDMLQATPMLSGLKEKYPGCHVTMLANRLFADLRLDPRLVDEVVYFDQNGLYEFLQDDAHDLAEKYDHVRAFVDRLGGRRYDLILNLPSDANNHLLATILSARGGEVRGAVYTPDRALALKHPSMYLFYTMSEVREFNRFNLVDLLNLSAGVRPSERRLRLEPSPEGEAFAERFLAGHGVAAGDFLVALQPGASEERKRWSPSRFAELADALAARFGARVLLCGSRSEQPLGRQITGLCRRPLIDAVGRTTLDGLAALLRRAALLVTNDTGTMHIATAVGTRVIDLSNGPVYFHETGPYAEGNVVVQGDIECFPCHFTAVCHHLSCRDRITVPMVLRLAEAVRDGRPPGSLDPREFAGVRVYVSRFNDAGRIDFLPAFRYPLTDRELLSFLYTHMWEALYGLRAGARPVPELLAEIGKCYDIGDAGALAGACAGHAALFRELSASLGEAITRLRAIQALGHDPAQAPQIARLSAEVTAQYEGIILSGRVQPVLKPLTIHLRLGIDSQEEGTVDRVATGYLEVYESIAGQAQFLTGLLDAAAAELAVRAA